MKSRSSLWIGISVLWFTLVFSACSLKTAGSASVTTNGTVAGVVEDSLGKRQPGVVALLIRTDSDPSASSDPLFVRTEETNARGEYVFSDVPAGEYRLLVRNLDGKLAATLGNIEVAGDASVKLPVSELAPVQGIQVDAVSVPFQAGDRFFIPGSDLQQTVTVEDVGKGSMLLQDVPIGEYEQVMWVPNGLQTAVPLRNTPFEVQNGVLQLVVDYETENQAPVGFATVQRNPSLPLGGSGGDTAIVGDSAELRAALADTAPKVVLVDGMVKGNGLLVSVKSHKTILGLGQFSGLDSLGLSIRKDSNIVIRNLYFKGGNLDAISIEEHAKHIWVDHNTFDAYDDGLIEIYRWRPKFGPVYLEQHARANRQLRGSDHTPTEQDCRSTKALRQTTIQSAWKIPPLVAVITAGSISAGH